MRKGYKLLTWTRQGLTYCAVSDLAPANCGKCQGCFEREPRACTRHGALHRAVGGRGL